MKYEDNVKELAKGDKGESERIDLLIKGMCRLTNDLLDLKYAEENYKGTGTAIEDKLNIVKNDIATLEGDLDIYAALMNITDKVRDKKEKRVNNIIKKKG